jgi:hypothetical protein
MSHEFSRSDVRVAAQAANSIVRTKLCISCLTRFESPSF